MRRLGVLGTCTLAVLALVLLAVPLLVDAGRSGSVPAAPPVAPSPVPPDSGPIPPGAPAGPAREAIRTEVATMPTLTPAEAARASALALADPAIERLVAGQAVEVERIGPWTTFGDEAAGRPSELIGAAVEIALPAPISVRGQRVPELIYDSREATSTPYQTVQSRLDADGVQSLTVLVDLRTERVVGVIPGPPGVSTSTFTRPPGFELRVTPRSGPD